MTVVHVIVSLGNSLGQLVQRKREYSGEREYKVPDLYWSLQSFSNDDIKSHADTHTHIGCGTRHPNGALRGPCWGPWSLVDQDELTN